MVDVNRWRKLGELPKSIFTYVHCSSKYMHDTSRSTKPSRSKCSICSCRFEVARGSLSLSLGSLKRILEYGPKCTEFTRICVTDRLDIAVLSSLVHFCFLQRIGFAFKIEKTKIYVFVKIIRNHRAHY